MFPERFDTPPLPASVAALILALTFEAFPGNPEVYLDSNTTSQINNGKAATPFATVAQAVAAGAFVNGVIIGVVAGSHFRETLNLSAFTNTTVVKVGQGPDPLFDCSDMMGVSQFSLFSTNVYAITLTVQGTVSLPFFSMFENGVEFVLATSQANCTATAGSYFINTNAGGSAGTITSTTFQILVHTSDSSNPGTNGRLYEYRSRDSGYIEGSSTQFAFNIRSRRNLANDGSLTLFGTSYNLTADQGTKHNIIANVGSTLINPSCTDAYFAGQGANLLTIFTPNPVGNEVTTIVNPRLRFTPGIATNSSSTNGPILQHSSGASSMSTVIVGGTIVGGSSAFAFSNVQSVLVTGLTAVGCNGGIAGGAHLIVSGCTLQVSNLAVVASAGFNTTITNNYLSASLGFFSGGAGVISITSGALVVDIERNIIAAVASAASGNNAGVFGFSNAQRCVIRNNNFPINGYNITGLPTGLSGTPATIQDNSYFSGLFGDGATNFTLTQLQALTPCEALGVLTQTLIPTTGTTVQANGQPTTFLKPAGTLSTLTVNLPVSPYDGQPWNLASSQVITTLTLAASGKTIGTTTTTLAVNTPVHYTYMASSSTWVKG